ncbi:MAG: polyprenol monophosphomannose synthase [Acidimicrobiia bacterium]|nr:polyprenol monophosphomannose synthase [Acidimicrobiia bacterium]
MQDFGMSVLVIVPTYNERDNITPIAQAVRSLGYALLIVDDGSPDGTGAVADQLAATDENIHVLHRSEKQGLGPAYAAGFQRGLELGAEILCEMDADFSHNPADLPRLVSAIKAGADLAIGSRYVPGGGTVGWPWHRRFLSRAGNVYAAMMLGIAVKDSTAGFRAFRDTTIRKVEPSRCEASGYGFQIEMAWKTETAGLDIVEVPITFKDRVVGESKMDRRIAVEAILLITRWGFRRLFRRSRSA